MFFDKDIKQLLETEFKKSGYIDVVKLSEALGISVYAEDLKDITSYIEYDKNKQETNIFVNYYNTKERQRFSIAHELGHFYYHNDILKEKGIIGRENGNSLNYEEESKVDKFAAELLMPPEFVSNYLNEIGVKDGEGISSEVLNKFMKKFNVSKPCAILRLRDLEYITGNWLW